MITALGSLLVVSITAAGARSVGSWIGGGRWRFEHPVLRVASEVAVGLLLVSHACLAATLVGMAHPVTFWAILAALAAIGIPGLARDAGAAVGTLRRWTAERGATGIVAAVTTAILAVWHFLLAQLPPLAFDSLAYHLEVPRRILEAGRFPLFVDNFYGYFPQLGEMLFLLGMATVGDAAAKLFHVLFGLLLLAALYGLARRWLPRPGAALAVFLFVTVPSVMQVFPFAYVDLAFSLYLLLALAATLEYTRDRRTGWLLAAGLLAGGACATKYTGVQVVAMLLLLLLADHLMARRRGIPWTTALLPAIAGLVFLPYPVRNLVMTGWPLFPFPLGPLELNPALNWGPDRADAYLDFLSYYGMAEGMSPLLARLWAPVMVFLRARFWEYAAYDGMIGPVFLLVPIVLLLARRRITRGIGLLGLFTLVYVYYWSMTTLQVRFLLPVLPLLALLLAWGLDALRSRRLSLALTGLTVLLAGAMLPFGIEQNIGAAPWNEEARPWDYWLGRESRHEFWYERVQPYPLYHEANQRCAPEDTLFLVDMWYQGYLLDCTWRGDYVFQHWTLQRILADADGPAEVDARLRDMGITHLMIYEGLLTEEELLPPPERRLLAHYLRTRTRVVVRNPKARIQVLRALGRAEGSAADRDPGS